MNLTKEFFGGWNKTEGKGLLEQMMGSADLVFDDVPRSPIGET